jgi:MFS family permease
MVISQGFLVRRLIPKIGEKRMLVTGLVLMASGLVMISISDSIALLAVAQTLLAFGFSFTNPSAMGSISLLAKSTEQGEILGTAQGSSSLGRIIGPAAGGWLYGHISMGSPFVAGGILALGALAIVISNLSSLPNSGQKKQVAV